MWECRLRTVLPRRSRHGHLRAHQRVFVASHNTSVYDLAPPIPRWKNPKPIRIIYAVVAAVFAVIILAYIALDCYNLTNNYDGAPDGLYRPDSRLGTAYYAIYLVISIVAVITMIISLVQMNSRHVASGVSPSQPNTTSAC